VIDDAGRPRPSPRGSCREKDEAEGHRSGTVRNVKGRWSPPTAPFKLDGPFALWDRFLAKRSRRTFTLSCMAFQDCYTVDLERLKNCCIHVVGPGGRLIPFCARYCTASDGTPLYPER